MSSVPVVPMFYEMRDYTPHVNNIVPRNINREHLHFSELSRRAFESIMYYFSEVSVERVGVLHGEYILLNGLMLIRQDGMTIKANCAWEDRWGANTAVDNFCHTHEFLALRKEILAGWNQCPQVQSPVLVAHPYAHNYYHWTCETVTKNRFFGAYPNNPLVVPGLFLSQLFQKELLVQTSKERSIIIPPGTTIRVRDPILSHELLGENGIQWLRKTTGISGKQGGNRKIYLRRTPNAQRERAGGGISETREFLQFLKEYGFESIDFTEKPLSIEQQIRLLDGASVILAPHGAALTNLAYLNPPLSVIEIVRARTPRAIYMHIASMLKFQYYGIYSELLDANEDVIINIDELRDAMKSCLA